MEAVKIDRINELYRKSKAEGLTEAEKKEQQILRRENMLNQALLIRKVESFIRKDRSMHLT